MIEEIILNSIKRNYSDYRKMYDDEKDKEKKEAFKNILIGMYFIVDSIHTEMLIKDIEVSKEYTEILNELEKIALLK